MEAPNFLTPSAKEAFLWGGRCRAYVCICVPQCVFWDLRRSVWPEDVFSVIHISTVNSAGKRRHKCKQNREKDTEISMYSGSLSV